MVRSFPLRDQLPSALRGVILDIHWDLGQLHGLNNLRTVTVPVENLAWHLELPFWSVDGVPFQVSPNEVIRAPEQHRAQWDRTMAADLQFPLHVRIDLPAERMIILDGVHRLLKATVLGRQVVDVHILTGEDLNAIAV